MSHDDRVAIVFGSGRARVGRAIAADLATRGFRVVLHANRSIDEAERAAQELSDAGHTAIALQADITQEGDVRGLYQTTRTKWQRLDVVVNTSSIWAPESLEQTTAESLLQNFRVNALGSFLCTQHAGMIMTEQPAGGVIINFGDAGCDQPRSDYAAYYLSKGTIPTLTRSLAVEFSSRNPSVRVNCILPGSIMSPPEVDAAGRERRRQATLVKQADDVEPVCETVRYLINNLAATGMCIKLDGGRHLRGPFS